MTRVEKCPFCGGSPSPKKGRRGHVRIECPDCRVRTPYAPTVPDAARIWNLRRVTDHLCPVCGAVVHLMKEWTSNRGHIHCPECGIRTPAVRCDDYTLKRAWTTLRPALCTACGSVPSIRRGRQGVEWAIFCTECAPAICEGPDYLSAVREWNALHGADVAPEDVESCAHCGCHPVIKITPGGWPWCIQCATEECDVTVYTGVTLSDAVGNWNATQRFRRDAE